MPAAVSTASPVASALRSHAATVAALTVCLFLGAAQFQYIPPLRYFWSFNFWQYLPPGVGWGLGTIGLILCLPATRRHLLRLIETLGTRVPRLGSGRSDLLIFAGLVAVLWLLRDSTRLGDVRAHLTFVRIGVRYNSPDLGSTYLMWGFARWASAFGVEAFMAMQLFLTVSGALAIVVLRHAVRLLTPSVSDRAAILLFVLSGGLLRVLAGHVEVYNLLILASGLYLWASLAYLAGRSSLWVPSLALGGAIWVHASALCLIPSLLLLAGVERSDRGTPWIRVLAKLSLCAAPLLGFLAYASLFEPRWNLLLAWDSVERILGRKSTGHLTRLWVRGWGSYDSIGTDVVFLSSAHLKYLLNSLHLLAPLVLPILLAVTVLRPRRLVATPVNRFLLAAALPYVVYALSLRPFHGVWDWDLFSATALWLALLAACLLTQLLPAPSRPGALIWLIGVQALYVGIPFLLMGTLPICDGGPFFPGPRYAYPAIIQMNVPPPKALAPWL